jgi:hypothetical protein
MTPKDKAKLYNSLMPKALLLISTEINLVKNTRLPKAPAKQVPEDIPL